MRRSILLIACVAAGCARPPIRPAVTPQAPRTEALLVLPGFGYTGKGEHAFRDLSAAVARDGYDLYVPDFIARGGIAESRENLARFIRDQHLDRYERLHVFAFLAGAWTLNPLVEQHPLPNLKTVVYDRSPYQERAPRLALENLRFLTWVKYGSPVFDIARTPYPPLTTPDVKVAIVVETIPTKFVEKRAEKARRYGPYAFECDAFRQRHDDCTYVAMNHDDLYARFAEVWPEVRSFIRTGHFEN
jgi:hypothetical protein